MKKIIFNRIIIDRTSKYAIALKFNKTHSFSDGLARVKVDNKWSYIDRIDKYAIAPKFKEAMD